MVEKETENKDASPVVPKREKYSFIQEMPTKK